MTTRGFQRAELRKNMESYRKQSGLKTPPNFDPPARYLQTTYSTDFLNPGLLKSQGKSVTHNQS